VATTSTWHPTHPRQYVLPAVAGALSVGVVVALIVFSTRLPLIPAGTALVRLIPGPKGPLVQIAPQDADTLNALAWLQALANAAIVVALVFTAWVAVTARLSFRSQRHTAQEELRLANEQAQRQAAAAQSSRDHASMTLLLQFVASWEADIMLRWRSQLADALLSQRAGDPLPKRTLLAFTAVAKVIERVGYCVAHDLVDADAAWNEFGEFWEIYWAASGSLGTAPSGDPEAWKNANSLIATFLAHEPDGKLSKTTADIDRFLLTESNVAAVEELILETAIVDRPSAVSSPSHPASSPDDRSPGKRIRGDGFLGRLAGKLWS
jgi:hypothetical protein